MNRRNKLSTRNLALMGMLGALAGVMMLIEFPVPFVAPDFYKFDFSELPVLIGAFALGPVAGVIIEFVKILVKLVLKPTTSAFVGELANFVIGSSLIVPAALVYRINRTKKGAVIGMTIGTVCISIVGAVFNALVLIPFYAQTTVPLETILSMGAVLYPAIDNVWMFVLLCVAPFNFLKGVVVSLLTALIYKRVSMLIHSVA